MRRVRLAAGAFLGCVLGAGVILACTGDDPALATPDDPDATPDALADNANPTDGANTDGGTDGEAGPKMMTCTVEYPNPNMVAELTGTQRFSDDTIQLLPVDTDTVRIIVREPAKPDYTLYEQKTKGPGSGAPNVVSVPVGNAGRVHDIIRLAGGGYGVLVSSGATGIPSLDVIEISNGSLPANFTTIKNLLPAGGHRFDRAHVIELAGGTYFWVGSEETPPTSGNWSLECGRGPGGDLSGTGPNPFATFSSVPGRDGNSLVRASGSGKVHYFQAGDVGGGGAVQPTVAYTLPDTCIGLTAGTTVTSAFAFPAGRTPYFIGGTTSTDPNKFDLYFADFDTTSPTPTLATWQGRLNPSSFTNSVTIAPPSFVSGPSFTSSDLPIGGGSNGTAFGDSVALLGAGIGGDGGLNFAIWSVDGTVTAKNSGGTAFLLGKPAASIRRSTVALAQDLGPLVKTFFLAWVEDVPTPSPHDALYVNRIRCITQ